MMNDTGFQIGIPLGRHEGNRSVRKQKKKKKKVVRPQNEEATFVSFCFLVQALKFKTTESVIGTGSCGYEKKNQIINE